MGRTDGRTDRQTDRQTGRRNRVKRTGPVLSSALRAQRNSCRSPRLRARSAPPHTCFGGPVQHAETKSDATHHAIVTSPNWLTRKRLDTNGSTQSSGSRVQKLAGIAQDQPEGHPLAAVDASGQYEPTSHSTSFVGVGQK